jgi:hypothetical protein
MRESLRADELLAFAIEAMERKDRFALVEFLNRHDAKLAAEVYGKLQSEFYWKRKDVPLMVAMSQAGIQHGLTAAGRATDAEEARALHGAAKMLAYNLASFTWPGWDEKGIVLGSSDVAAGFDAARLNLRLAEELGRPDKAKANAWWALGAHQLVVADCKSAHESFIQGKAHAERGEAVVLASAMDGYALMTGVLADPTNSSERAKFDGAVTALKNSSQEDASDYANQLSVALGVFVKP